MKRIALFFTFLWVCQYSYAQEPFPGQAVEPPNLAGWSSMFIPFEMHPELAGTQNHAVWHSSYSTSGPSMLAGQKRFSSQFDMPLEKIRSGAGAYFAQSSNPTIRDRKFGIQYNFDFLADPDQDLRLGVGGYFRDYRQNGWIINNSNPYDEPVNFSGSMNVIDLQLGMAYLRKNLLVSASASHLRRPRPNHFLVYPSNPPEGENWPIQYETAVSWNLPLSSDWKLVSGGQLSANRIATNWAITLQPIFKDRYSIGTTLTPQEIKVQGMAHFYIIRAGYGFGINRTALRSSLGNFHYFQLAFNLT